MIRIYSLTPPSLSHSWETTEILWLPPLPLSYLFFHLTPRWRGGGSAILFFTTTRSPPSRMTCFFTKIAWRIRVKHKQNESNPSLMWNEPTHPPMTYCLLKLQGTLVQKYLYHLFFTKIAWRLWVNINEMNSIILYNCIQSTLPYDLFLTKNS